MSEEATPAADAADEEARLWAEATGETLADTSKEEPEDEPKEAQPAADEPAAAPVEPDPWASVPEALRAQYDDLRAAKADLEQKERSARGRLSAQDRKINELQTQVNARAAEISAAKPDIKARVSSIREDFPEVSDVLDDFLASIDERIEASRSASQTAIDAVLDTTLAGQEAKLAEAHPDWVDLTNKHGDEILAWADDQPKRVREMMQRNSTGITNAAEAAEILTLFKAFKGLTPPAKAEDTKPDTKRQRQLAGAASVVPGGRAAVGDPEPADEAGLWQAAVKQVFKGQ